MSDDPWEGLAGRGFRFENIGRPAVFILPEEKLGIRAGETTVGEMLDAFLGATFGGSTSFTVENFGQWTDESFAVHYDRGRLYEVSFRGKELVTVLAAKLAEIATLIGEQCIYFKAGQYSSLIYPDPKE